MKAVDSLLRKKLYRMSIIIYNWTSEFEHAAHFLLFLSLAGWPANGHSFVCYKALVIPT